MNVRLAARIGRIAVSSTLAVMMEAERYKSSGADVVDFSVGEPDFPTPGHVKRAGIHAIEQNYTKYTATSGLQDLREAICKWHAAQFGSSYTPAECIVSVGGKQAIFNTISILVDSMEEVIIPVPYWVSYPDMVNYVGGRPIFVHTAEPDFRLLAEQIEAAISPSTKMVIVNSPCNPTGAVISANEFARIHEVCKHRNVWLLSDECYSHFLYDGAKRYSVASICDSKSNTIVAGSLSKTFAMTGWRIGYALAPRPLIEAMLKLQSQSTANATTISQHAALEALRGSTDSVMRMLTEYSRRRTRMVEGLRSITGITCNAPEGSFYVFPKIVNGNTSNPEDTAQLAHELLKTEHVALVPGEAFGLRGYWRLSYATSMDRIEEGLRRIRRFFRGSR